MRRGRQSNSSSNQNPARLPVRVAYSSLPTGLPVEAMDLGTLCSVPISPNLLGVRARVLQAL
jgi:hypothetical protein